MCLRRSITAVFGALALAVAAPTSAHAATGTFSYVSPESGPLDITSPANGECRLLLQGAGSAANGTNATAVLFSDRGCEQRLTTMAPGERRGFGAPIPRSVLFN
ncbi:hypothetical protein IPZ58_12110 [Streptomyces roseoverticillatus]|uniref:hypothetical protein n=1 Tax=Streptomyces roseoverticillatus TaxID=66429 RepID=UPI001F18484A|nr:hypothetical protein [Streptomyces roseoverticillatus]MCF3102326.1 hypothetical protein [Streptomyces roseoverticillatus]